MNRAERRRLVADIITRHIAGIIRDELGTTAQVYAIPDKGILVVRHPTTGDKVTHENIRFCCPGHCWYDLEQDAVTQILDQFGYMILKVFKLEDPPADPDHYG